MTRRADFTDEQWTSLLEAGPAIARTVATAAGSGRQTERELEAFVDMVQDAASAAAGDTLLTDLVVELQQRIASGAIAPPNEPYFDGIEAARRAGAILSVVADPTHGEAIRDWLLQVARRVAESAREGGLLGVGGEDVSRPEETAISEIAYALGADPTAGTAWEAEGA